ncbi:MAG: D-Ala-D-Ala carboxypeptidase family metallohydrolase [candidate division WOR-3 bacterium]|nr:D-Ala-D-Ala carboxypeptidase family metallohydrolase [candidate division WOR-3 bacterium]MCX7836518.1 D-Ala-D-Ala carboxypeptidase family metallohydrolase [candidate division WOR-3 bacterium]MDW8113756.1 D-Ala-D-Ala carboxypeptidase family metallohydrolase [candidate division WOR-3 bacterium]
MINDLTYEWRVFSYFLLPKETLKIKIISQKPIGYFYEDGEVIEKAKEDSIKEIYYIFDTQRPYTKMVISDGKKEIRINFLSLIPYNKEKRLGEFYIGKYPKYSRHPNLKNVKGFLKVLPEIKDLYLSPDYQLKDFLNCRSSYIYLREELIYKLQLFSDYLKSKGIKKNKFKIYSAFRTPAQNYSGGGGRNSCHMYGGACDIGLDLDGNGKISLKEKKELYNYAQDFEEKISKEYPKLVGGLGYYRRKPFIHIDVRGEKERWFR